jgi:hypothetical protein
LEKGELFLNGIVKQAIQDPCNRDGSIINTHRGDSLRSLIEDEKIQVIGAKGKNDGSLMKPPVFGCV